MRVVLLQTFPLGRFHATPWRANPFDDPFGEWPPSPWRLARAVVARWHQANREIENPAPMSELDQLLGAICASQFSFHIPPGARPGQPIRQYLPTRLLWSPQSNKEGTVPQLRQYGKSLYQDNYWAVPSGESGRIWWFLDGDRWGVPSLNALQRCLERVLYFGRAESFSRLRVCSDDAPEPNCMLSELPASTEAAPVLTPRADCTRAELERPTGDPAVAGRTLPPGARLQFATLPPRQPAMAQKIPAHTKPIRILQFALGLHVSPRLRDTVHLTARFRSAVLRELLRLTDCGKWTSWSAAPISVRDELAPMFGKDSLGRPSRDHSHAEFLIWWDDRGPRRLLAWRESRPFDPREQQAIFAAATRPLAWANGAHAAQGWTVRLVPLDDAVPPPPGFDGIPAADWESVTPYVPPRHHLRNHRTRPTESIPDQIRWELTARGIPGADGAVVEVLGPTIWVSVHIPRRLNGTRGTSATRCGYRLRLRLPTPMSHPIRLGHSSSFGLGLFRPTRAG